MVDQLERLRPYLRTPGPSGFESERQRHWIEQISDIADDVRTDAYDNAVAVYNEDATGSVAFTSHADEIGFVVNRIDERGFVYLDAVGRVDQTVSRGQRVVVHADGGPVNGVFGQTAVQLRDSDGEPPDVTDQHVDIGATDRSRAAELVNIGDPVSLATRVWPLDGSRVAGRMDNGVGMWATAEGFRRAVKAGIDCTVYAVNTIQEEIGVRGARMVELGVDPDVFVSVDVDFATDHPAGRPDQRGDIELGGGPVVGRGMGNHPQLVTAVREAAADAGTPVQLQANGNFTGTHADAFYLRHGGTPTAKLGIPCRHMHTPVEAVDLDDVAAVPDVLEALAERAGGSDELVASKRSGRFDQ